MKFITKISYNGKVLRVKLPLAFKNQRFEAYYEGGKLLIARGSGVKAIQNEPSAKVCYVTFGKNWVSNMPKIKQVFEVEMVREQFTVDIPKSLWMVVPEIRIPKTPKTNPPVDTYSREQIARMITVLNNYCEKHGFRFDVMGGRLSLVKQERIEGAA